MKKDGDKISNLKLYTKMLGMFFTFAGLIIGLLMVMLNIPGAAIFLLFLGLILFGLLLIATPDSLIKITNLLP